MFCSSGLSMNNGSPVEVDKLIVYEKPFKFGVLLVQ